ncbi:hypothetical protein N9L28_06305 [Luminiphilus sp.]|nr:hypothetical protein [Luminiphilus sp.]
MTRKPHLAKQIWAALIGTSVTASFAQDIGDVKEGDVISADVINALIAATKNATPPIEATALVGEWSLTQYMPYNGQPGNGTCRQFNNCNVTGTQDSADDLSRYRTDTVTVTDNGTSLSWTQDNYDSFVNAHTNNPNTGTLGAIGDTIIFQSGGGFSYYYGKKLNDNTILLQSIKSGSNSFNTVVLSRNDGVPNAVTALTATDTASGIKLTWTDQSTNESGFRVERKAAAVSSAWATLQSLGVDVVSFTDTSPAIDETWQYRVFAYNNFGDAYTSSVVQKTHTVTSN